MATPISTELNVNSATYSNAKLHLDAGVKYMKPINIVKDERKWTPTVEDLTVYEPVTVEKVAEKLELYGGCFVRNLLPKETSDKMWSEIEPHFEGKGWKGDFFPKETQRVCGTFVKSKTAAEELLVQPLVSALADKFVGKENFFVIGDEVISGYSAPQLNSGGTFDIGPGARKQALHRDDMVHHNIRHYQEKYEYGTETAFGCCFAHGKTTKQNGATRFVPGSHLWDHFRLPKEEECVYAELDVGDSFFMLASCFHGGSANTTTDEHRRQTIFFYTQGTLRQEDNIFLETPLEYFKSLSVPVLKALGLTTSEPFCGWIRDIENPLSVIKPEFKQEQDDPFKDTYKADY